MEDTNICQYHINDTRVIHTTATKRTRKIKKSKAKKVLKVLNIVNDNELSKIMEKYVSSDSMTMMMMM